MTFPRWLGVLVVVGGCAGDDVGFSTIYPVMSLAPPDVLDFGEVVANEEIRQVDLIITNNGPRSLEIQEILFGDPAFTATLPEGVDLSVEPMIIEDEKSVTVPITFTPTEVRSYDTTLTLQTNEEEPQTELPITATGRVPYAPEIEVTPLTLDFGEVPSGDRIDLVEVKNIGDADLVIGSTSREGSPFFFFDDISGSVITPGTSRQLLVTYAPLLPDGDSGTLLIPSNDADEGDPGVLVTFEGNGGGTAEYPEAVVACPGNVDIAEPKIVTFDGSASSDPLGGTLTYEWAIIRRPDGVDPDRTLVPVDQPVADLLVDAAGTWEVALTVYSDRDGDGTPDLPSLPAKCTFQARPIDNLHVELTWSGDTSDLDLHLAQEGAAFFSVPGEVSYCNPNPDWGTQGDPTDDGHLSQDDSDGFGPEIAGVTLPQDGIYIVRVHAFDDGEDGAVTATVTVQLNGEQAWTGSRVMNRNEVWEVGQVNWPDATFGVYNQDLWDALGVRECQP